MEREQWKEQLETENLKKKHWILKVKRAVEGNLGKRQHKFHEQDVLCVSDMRKHLPNGLLILNDYDQHHQNHGDGHQDHDHKHHYQDHGHGHPWPFGV